MSVIPNKSRKPKLYSGFVWVHFEKNWLLKVHRKSLLNFQSLFTFKITKQESKMKKFFEFGEYLVLGHWLFPNFYLLVTCFKQLRNIYVNTKGGQSYQHTVLFFQRIISCCITLGTILFGFGAVFTSAIIIFMNFVQPYGLCLSMPTIDYHQTHLETNP